MSPSLSSEQRQAITSEGTPLPIIDDETGLRYLLLSVQVLELPDGSIAAAIPGLGLYGEGDASDEAVLAVAEAARLLCER